MGILSATLGLALGAIVSGAYRVQVEDGRVWSEAAEKQRDQRQRVEAKRGTIADRNGTALAMTVEVPSVSADVVEMLRGVEGEPAQSAVLRDAAARIAQILGLDGNQTYEKLATRRRYVSLKHRVSGDEALAIRALGDVKAQVHPVRGLAIGGEPHRYYPDRELAAPLLGFVAPDGAGKDGLELSFDDELRGHAEDVKGMRDRTGRLVYSDGNEAAQPTGGRDVALTIDQAIQHVAERELAAAMGTYETRGASIVVMDPNSGEILALASVPGYNPNDYSDSEADARRNRVVTDRFEPGSVMKVFTVATALAAGTLSPTEPIFCEHGSYRLENVTIHDTHLNDWLTPTQILAKSSNIGALKIALKVGEPGMYAGLRRFGFGEPTGLPLPGEASGVLRPRGRPWFDVETANASFGQGISVTTVQLATAMSAIANGGKLLEPQLVKRVTDERGVAVREATTHVRREVVPAHVARLVADMLTAVTEEGGTGVEAAVPGFRVAGKTATAQKADPATGKYAPDKYTASFVGFVPAERPRLVIAVVLDEPMIGHYGGDLAGPVFRRVAESTLRYLGVVPQGSAKLADVRRDGDPADVAIAALRPDAGAPASEAPVLVADGIVVPDASGMPARDAVRALSAAGFVPEIQGSGRVVRQVPAASSRIAKGATVRIVLEPSS